MKWASIIAVGVAAPLLSHALFTPEGQHVVLHPESEELYLVEYAEGATEWIREDDKWELRRKGINFMDITSTGDLGTVNIHATRTFTFPSLPAYNSTIQPKLSLLNKTNMHDNLETFSAFHTRFYRSDSGAESGRWLLNRVNETVAKSGAHKYGATVEAFEHAWGQHSVIARIPGKSEKTIVIGAHQDSINLFLPWLFAAPGADDDGSGTVTILEALRVLLQFEGVAQGKAANTIEFHWYSAEEGGLLGSQKIFQAYEKDGRDVRAMLQQDMTGYVQKTLDAGKEERVGVITDFVDPDLTDFIKKVITEYCDIPYVETKCGYACSDHASASKAGYPSAFVIESDFEYSDKKIHTTEDKLEFLSFDHMVQHAKLTLAFAYELAYAKFED